MTLWHYLKHIDLFLLSATSMACQSLIPTGVNVGCRRCLIDVGHCVIPDNVVMKTRKRTQNMSHLVGISSNARERMYGPVPQGPVSQGVVAQSQTCQPLHGNPAVQFIPICSSHLSNSNVFPGTHESSQPYCLPKGGHFWRPFWTEKFLYILCVIKRILIEKKEKGEEKMHLHCLLHATNSFAKHIVFFLRKQCIFSFFKMRTYPSNKNLTTKQQ